MVGASKVGNYIDTSYIQIFAVRRTDVKSTLIVMFINCFYMQIYMNDAQICHEIPARS